MIVRPLALLKPLTPLAFALATLPLACAEQPVNVAVRSLEQSGDVAFLCLQDSAKETPGRWLDACSGTATDAKKTDYQKLYALVTQTIRGEVALIDLTAGVVVDLDKSTPGFNFIPVGANPTGIVTTPGSTAAFVGSAEAGRESIWVIPSKRLKYLDDQDAGPPMLTSFAACALPSAPGEMMVLVQPFGDDECPANDGNLAHSQGDLSNPNETHPAGVRKLLVTLPDLGEVWVLDAQELLDQPPGSLQACDRVGNKKFKLATNLPPTQPGETTPPGGYPPGQDAEGGVCELTAAPNISLAGAEFEPRPAGLALDPTSKTLYIADEQAPVIHALDVGSPCTIKQLPPLLPMSVERPERVVTTRKVAVSPATSDGKRFLYATDLHEGSVMVFDVSRGVSDRTPLQRPDPARSPDQPRDRIAFAVPVRDVAFVLRDDPAVDPTTGAAQVGLLCDPADDNSPASRQRTSADHTDGARPTRLRGIFAALALTNGQIVVVDVDDFDAPCRRPTSEGACANAVLPNYDDARFADYDGASGEKSCNVIERHQARSAFFFDYTAESKGRVPSVKTFPQLSLDNSVLPTDQTPEGLNNPKLLAPVKDDGFLVVGGKGFEGAALPTDPTVAEQNTLVFDLREPRAHHEQDWTVVYEGAIPGFNGHVGRLEAESQQGLTWFYDGSAFFCDRGVHDLDAVRKQAEERRVDAGEVAQWAEGHADVLHITDDFPDRDDPYWATSAAGRCSWVQCRETYGLVDDPKKTRDFPIVEAYQGALRVRGVGDREHCCFPVLPTYTVRGRDQWIVTGGASGFLHKVVSDPATQRCIDTCDPNRALLNGRAFARERDAAVPEFDGPGAFRNPVLQFVVWSGREPTERDTVFSFRQNDGFAPLSVSLAASSTYILPQNMRVVPQTGELAFADGSAQGLVLVDLGALRISRSFF